MSILSPAQARSYAAQAGFSGNGLLTIVAIAQAESSLNTQANHTNGDGSVDRGILQINNRWHPEVSNTCAYDPVCAFKAGYKISNGGTNFKPWSTYASGAYLRYMSTNSGGTEGQSNSGKQWYSYPILPLNDYATTYKGPGTDTPHYAVDIQAPQDTPFYFLEPGTITVADYKPWGGEVFEKPDNGKPYQEYVYHLDEIDVQTGQHVNAGQLIGLSGGQTSGGKHPTSPQWSTGPHIHFGLFTKFTNTPIGTIPYGPDPNPLIDAAKSGGVTGGGGDSGGDSGSTAVSDLSAPPSIAKRVNDLLSEFPGFAGIALALDAAEQFPGVIWYNPGTNVKLVPGGNVFGDAFNQVASAVFDPQDYVGAGIRSVLDTIFSNTVPLLIRAFIVGIGLLLIAGLVMNAVNSGDLVNKVSQLIPIEEAAEAGVMVA